ncbi:hypothetical protein FOCC_FOCC006124 [Frankliniella occidentalis]|nr:hypothetical protein FOCC_FOCC006124 [Frankliniella occidentalis]
MTRFSILLDFFTCHRLQFCPITVVTKMNHKEEQNNELEALESIYCGELEVLSRDSPVKFQIPVKSEEYDAEEGSGYACTLKFTYTERYPEDPPEIEIEDMEHFGDDDEVRLKDHLLEQAEIVMGEVMIFTLVSAAQEWLSTNWDNAKRSQDEERDRKIREEEDAERKRFEGTLVNPETFFAWKAKFDAEFAHLKVLKEKDTGKLTGRQMFMNDSTLVQSDLKFLEDSEDSKPFDDDNIKVEVDEDLFKDIEELDIGEENFSDSE